MTEPMDERVVESFSVPGAQWRGRFFDYSRQFEPKDETAFETSEELEEEDVQGIQVMPSETVVERQIASGSETSSERLDRYRALVSRAVDVFGDEITASRWLSTPSADLENLVPLQIARNHNYDANTLSKLFEPVFVRIEHGIYG